MHNNQLGENIAKYLELRSMTQKDLAIRLNIATSTLSRYISGEREPKPDVIANLATALGTTTDALLGVEQDDGFNHSQVKRLIARNASNMTMEEKRELMNALFGEE